MLHLQTKGNNPLIRGLRHEENHYSRKFDLCPMVFGGIHIGSIGCGNR